MNKNILLIASIMAAPLYTFAADENASTAAMPAEPVAAAATLADEVGMKDVFEKFSASVSVGYESEFVFRGVEICGASINPMVNIGYDIGEGFAAYAGFWNNTSIDGSTYEENDFYTGLTYTIDAFTFELGYVAYTYPDGGNTNEIKVAAYVDTTEWLGEFNISPAAYYWYDFTLNTNTIEIGLTYSAPVTKWLIGSEWGSINLAGVYGYIAKERDEHDYAYVQFKADAVVSINDYASVYTGIRYSHKTAGGEEVSNNVWFGTGISLGF